MTTKVTNPERTPRKMYPVCPDCGKHTVVAAMMTGGAIRRNGEFYYKAGALSVYCCNASCNYDMPLTSIPYPPPLPNEKKDHECNCSCHNKCLCKCDE